MLKCAVCHHSMVKKTGEIDLRIEGKLYIVRNVFYEECLFCGERVLSPEVLKVSSRKLKIRIMLRRRSEFLYWKEPMDEKWIGIIRINLGEP